LKRRQSKFNTVLVQAVQEGLDSIGPSISDAVLFHLQRTDAISSNPPLVDPEAFDDGLNKIFGYGAKIIEKRILEVLYEKLEAPRKIQGDFRFPEEVRQAQKLLGSLEMLPAEDLQQNHRETPIKT